MPELEELAHPAEVAGCTCPPCKRKVGDPTHGVHEGVIHGYEAEPRGGWRVHRTPAEVASGSRSPSFGVELETSVPRRVLRDLADRPVQPQRPYAYGEEAEEYERQMVAYRTARAEYEVRNARFHDRQRAEWRAQGDLTAVESCSVMGPRGMWLPSHDGSVSGPEFKSSPATLAEWHRLRPTIAESFKALRHGGLRSHDGDTCGAHINIGADAFDGDTGTGRVDPDHLDRFIALWVSNPRWTTKWSQRTHDSTARWARFTTALTNAASRRDLCVQYAQYGYASTDHSVVINLGNSGRVEFRAPRGTLRIDRFYGRLEAVAASVEYTRDPHNVTRPSEFIRWMLGRPEYAEASRYMAEKFPGRVEAVAA